MSVRKAAGLEPSGLMPPKLGEKVSKTEVESVMVSPSQPVIAANDQAPRPLPSRDRVGTFIVADTSFRDVERLADILDGVLVVEAQSLYYQASTQYIGLHVDFDHVEYGNVPPTYDIVWSNGKRIWVRRAR